MTDRTTPSGTTATASAPVPSTGRHDAPVTAAWMIGGLSLIVFTWMITLGRWDLFATRGFAGMLDVQARAIMDGHLWVPDGSLGFEGFVVDGRTYAYFGILPSLLRIPLFALTDRFDGRFTTVSMIAAYLVAYVSTVRLVFGVHRLARPDGRWSDVGRFGAVAFLVTVGLGSNLLHLASGAWVYHEAGLWGVAGVLAAFASIVGWLHEPRDRRLIAAALWTLVAWTSRGSLGLGPSVALGLLAVTTAFPHRLTRAIAPAPAAVEGNRRTAALLLTAAAVGTIAFAGVNVAKFGSPTDLPMDRQIQSIDPAPSRAAALDAYGGTIFSPRLVPSVVVQTVRPDLVRPTGVWPWVGFTHRQPPLLTAPVFDTVEPSAGVTVTHPLAVVLAGFGLIALLGRRATGRRDDGADPRAAHVVADEAPDHGPDPDGHPPGGPGLAALRPLVLGSALGTLPVLTIAFISQRYVTDLLPTLFVTAAAGLALLDLRVDTRPDGARRRRFARAAIAVLAVVGVWVTLATTWTFQRFHIAPDRAARASWIETTSHVADFVGSRPPFERADSIHDADGTAGTLLVVGACDGLYVGQRDGVWSPIEVTGAARVPTLRITGRPDVGAPVDLVEVDDLRISLVRHDDGHLRIDLHDHDRRFHEGEPFARPDDPFDLTVDLDDNLRGVHVALDGRDVAFVSMHAPHGPITIGGGAGPVGITDVRVPTPACDALTGTGA